MAAALAAALTPEVARLCAQGVAPYGDELAVLSAAPAQAPAEGGPEAAQPQGLAAAAEAPSQAETTETSEAAAEAHSAASEGPENGAHSTSAQPDLEVSIPTFQHVDQTASVVRILRFCKQCCLTIGSDRYLSMQLAPPCAA